MSTGQFTHVGDVITLKGDTIPERLWTKFFKVVAINAGVARLDGPFDDEACTQRTAAPD